MYNRVAVVEPSVRRYNEPTVADSVGAPEPVLIERPPITAPDSSAVFDADDTGM
jgi:hypothetical protein